MLLKGVNQRSPSMEQALVTKKDGKPFIANDNKYHEYTIEWWTDEKQPQQSFVRFFFDGDLVHESRRWVPVRPGRFLVGPWMPSWACDGRYALPARPMLFLAVADENPLRSPQFSTAHVDISSISIEPFLPSQGALLLSVPQTFDQRFGPGFEVHEGFESLPTVAAAGKNRKDEETKQDSP